jgi:hypothetical protein
VTSAAYFLPYKQLANMSEPEYSENGELINAGYDLNAGGMSE